jgi:hypothetical protein
MEIRPNYGVNGFVRKPSPPAKMGLVESVELIAVLAFINVLIGGKL